MKTIVFLFVALTSIEAQSLYGLHTQWDDDIKQWDITLDEGELEGSIEMTWRLKNDFTNWTYRIDGQRGSIMLKWDNNPNVWELRAGGKIINISTVWTGDFTSWRITDGDQTIKIERPFRNRDLIEWRLQADETKSFFWYNENDSDIRDWIIEDYLTEDYSLELKLAAVFISILHSI